MAPSWGEVTIADIERLIAEHSAKRSAHLSEGEEPVVTKPPAGYKKVINLYITSEGKFKYEVEME